MNKGFHQLFNTNPRYSTTISFILGLLLIDNLTAPEQNMLGNWIILLGQTILTNAAAQNIIESRIIGGILCSYLIIFIKIIKITYINIAEVSYEFM